MRLEDVSMETYKIIYTLPKKGEIVLQNLPFSQGTEVEITVRPKSKETLESWQREYLQRILSTSVWSEEDIQRIERAQKDWNQWQIEQL